MGAIRIDRQTNILNYLVNSRDRKEFKDFSSRLAQPPITGRNLQDLFLFGSFLRQKVYDDIDVIVVPKQHCSADTVDNVIPKIIDCLWGLSP